MQNENTSHDPFSWKYFFIALAVLIAFPLMHVILGWSVFVFSN